MVTKSTKDTDFVNYVLFVAKASASMLTPLNYIPIAKFPLWE